MKTEGQKGLGAYPKHSGPSSKPNTKGHQGPHTDNMEEESQDEITENEEGEDENPLDTYTRMNDDEQIKFSNM